MNILILTTHLNTGGITSYLLTLSRELIKTGNNVYVVSSGGNMVEIFSGAGVQHLQLNIRTKSELSLRIYLPFLRLARFIKENNIDVIHSQTRITQVMGQLLHKLTGKPYVSTCHGFFKTRLSRRLVPCWGQAVIAISPAVKNHLEKDFGVAPEKVFLVKNGLDINDFPLINEEHKQQQRQELNIGSAPVLGIVARLSDVKGHYVLINAMPAIVRSFPEVKLLIVGEGKMEEKLKKQVADLGLQGNINFYPVVNQTIESLRLFDIFIMPSIQEGLGLSVMEAQAAGLPVVASRVGGIPSLIDNGKTGMLFETKDSEELAQAVIDLLENPQKAREMGFCAREFIAKEYSAEQMAQETVGVYKKLI